MSTWTFAAFCDALKVLLDADTTLLALSPVPEVRVSVPHAQEDISDVIVLGIDAGDDEKGQTLMAGNTSVHDETVTVGCQAAVIRYGSGDVESKAARDRVLELMNITDRVVRDNPLEVGVQTFRKTLTNRQYDSFPADVDGAPVRVARCSFDIVYRARTTETP